MQVNVLKDPPTIKVITLVIVLIPIIITNIIQTITLPV